MHSALSTLAVATLVSVVSAQNGYGRFPCTKTVNGVRQADQSACLASNLVNPATRFGVPISNSLQGTRPSPVDSECVLEPESGYYFCGIAGATCTTASNCDNGVCSGGQCAGGFGYPCPAPSGGTISSDNCLGYLYCSAADLSVPGSQPTCGGLGTYCQDYTGPYDINNATQVAEQSNFFCASGYCAYTGNCATHVTTVGGSCGFDVYNACGPGLVESSQDPSCTCQLAAPGASQRARSRRSEIQRRNACPASHTACSVGNGFECIDVSSNIEQCGACASEGGVDCTTLEGVSAVGCVAGSCEIWSCEDGFTYDPTSSVCVASS
ncbi:hypothetical protein JCM8202_001624 [Rhodotorula sphaerocarpa]